MARGGPQGLGSAPPQLVWTIVRGDTARFKAYVTDDAKVALNIPDWTIDMEIKRPANAADLGTITDNATIVLTLTPEADEDDLPGEFTVKLTAIESAQLQTGDIFDIELRSLMDEYVWTVAQGSITVIEDVTN